VNQTRGLLADPDLLPLTIPEIRRMLWRLVWSEPSWPGRAGSAATKNGRGDAIGVDELTSRTEVRL
jgi:hypothetical protein